MDKNKTFVGIDLGTSNTVVSFFKEGKFDQVKFKGKKIIPSVLYYEDKDRIVFGDRALKKAQINPSRLIKEFKRDFGEPKKYELSFSDYDRKEENIVNTYVIDTNIFIQEPNILNQIPSTDLIKLPTKVIDELSYREDNAETKVSAEMALENIINQEKINNNISFESHRLDLLSDDLEKDSKNSLNDNKILSIAKFFSEQYENVFLITNDNGLILKSKSENPPIQTLTLDAFKNKQAGNEYQNKHNTLTITPKEASTELLKYVREESSKFLDQEVVKAVITVPAHFNQAKIGQVKEAGENAGFLDVRIQKEPIAVGFAYALQEVEDKTILVYDFGGGTFDVSILEVSDGELSIIAVDGKSDLGGKDVTDRVIDIIYENFLDEHDIDMYDLDDSGLSINQFESNKIAIWRAAEDAKIELSTNIDTTISIPNLHSQDGASVNIQFDLTRKEFETEITEIRKESLDIVKDLMKSNNLGARDIDEIVMAGGTSSIPSIKDSIKDTFGISPKLSIDTSVVISQGAVIEALRIWDEGNTLQKKIKYNNNALLEFGLGVKDYKFDLLIPAGTLLPFSVTKEYTTEKDNQETIVIGAFQRNQNYPNANRTHDKGISYIDEITIEGIPPRSIGELTIEVTFELTKDDTLDVRVNVIDKTGEILHKDNLKIKRATDDK